MSKSLNGLLHSRKFWLAVFGVAQSLFFECIPEFPSDVWQSIDALIIVVIMSIAIEDAAKKIGNGK